MTVTSLTVLLVLTSLISTLTKSTAFKTAILPNEFSKTARFASYSIQESRIPLKSGVTAQVLSSTPSNPTKPTLVFVHGSFHAAWCWTEYYFPYFTELGYPVVALSLRGTARTFAGQGVNKVKIQDHAKDLQAFLDQLSSDQKFKPILISHSFGGLVVMKHLEMHPNDATNLGGIVVMCSVPPTGNGKMTLRFLQRSLIDSWKITAGFAMKKCIENEQLCRDLFFGGQGDDSGNNDDFGVSTNDIQRYQSYFKRDTEAIIDIVDLMKNLPSKNAIAGKAPHLDQFPPCIVVGASRDFLVDRVGLDETTTYFGVEAPTIVDSPHDIMLGRNWKNGADAIDRFVRTEVL